MQLVPIAIEVTKRVGHELAMLAQDALSVSGIEIAIQAGCERRIDTRAFHSVRRAANGVLTLDQERAGDLDRQ